MDAYVPQCTSVVRLSQQDVKRGWPAWLAAVVWMLLLTVLPWWLGLPILLALVVALFVNVQTLHAHTAVIRRSLRWGLPGLLVSLWHALGGGVLGFTLALLGALIGFSLLVLLESSLDHRSTLGHGGSPEPSMEWNEMALAPIGPQAVIIELEPPHWSALDMDAVNPLFAIRQYADHACIFVDNHQITDIDPWASAVEAEGWIVIKSRAQRGVVLLQRTTRKQHRLPGWQLYGWQGAQPWLSRGDDAPPLSLRHVLGQGLPEK